MRTPFELPEGMVWRELTEQERSWLGAQTMGITQKSAAAYTLTYQLRHRETGETRWIENGGIAHGIEEGLDRFVSGVAFYYTEGNLGCGCNRTILWREAGGEPELSDDDLICDQKWDVVQPRWLAECDEDPYLRSADVPPWRTP